MNGVEWREREYPVVMNLAEPPEDMRAVCSAAPGSTEVIPSAPPKAPAAPD
jgi:hypothetical protein